MEFKLYICLRCGKSIKSTSSFPRYINAYKNLIYLLSCQPLNSAAILKYNTTSHLDFLSKSNKENIRLGTFNNSKQKIRPENLNNNQKDIKPTDKNKQRSAYLNWML